MSSPFLGEVSLFAFSFAPRGWAMCQGAILPISQNTALFSLMGTMYGGNGQSNFALPNLASRAACAVGQGPGLTPRTQGEMFGETYVTLLNSEMPQHRHGLTVYAQNNPANRSGSPQTGYALSVPSNAATTAFLPGSGLTAYFQPQMIQVAGGSQPHENRQPYLGLTYCIALQGVFPARN